MLVAAATPVPADCVRIIVWDEQHLVIERGSKWASRAKKQRIGSEETIDTVARAVRLFKERKGSAPHRAIVTARWDGHHVSLVNISRIQLSRAEVPVEDFGRES